MVDIAQQRSADPLKQTLEASPFVTDTDGGIFKNISFAQVLINYWQAAIRWKSLIAGIVIVSIGFGVLSTMLEPRRFTSTSEIQIGRGKRNITNVQGIEQPDDYMSDEFYNTQYALLKARSLAERVARNLKLGDNPEFLIASGIKPESLGTVTAGANQALTTEQRAGRENTAVGILMGGIAIHPEHNSSLVSISFTSQSPQWAARIANAWPAQYIAANIDREIGATADARGYLEQRLGDLRNRMQLSEQNLIDYASSHDIITLGATRDASGKTEEPRTLAASNLEALTTVWMAAKADLVAARSKASTRNSAANPDVVENPVISGLRAKRHELEGEYARLMIQFKPGYPAARAIKSTMDSLDVAIARETLRVGGVRQTTYAEAANREAELHRQVAEAKRQFDQQQHFSIQYHIFQREVDTNRQLYDSLLQRYKDIGIVGNVGTNNIVVVDEAKVPGGPSSPNLNHNVFVALMAGLLLSAAAVFAFETIGEGIRFPGDVERLLNLPLVGATPLTDASPDQKLSDPKSQISEAYFSVSTALAFATSHGLPKSILVTSAQPHEGKSTTSLGLAIAIGSTGKRVLLIDGDMRSPSVHKMLDYENSGGLSNILAGNENLQSFVGKSRFKNLSVILAGPSPLSPVELLSGDRLSQVMRTLGNQFDHIVVDSPPVVGIADAMLLGKAVEGTVLVIQAEGAAIRIIRAALQRLLIAQTRVLGVVVTKVNFGRFGYGYSYDYGYGNKDTDVRLAAE